jgi:hypothetical protein
MRVKNANRVKDAVRKRDGYQCRDCGMSQDEHIEIRGKQLHVHRLVRGTEYSVDGFALCIDCHGARHRKAGDLLRGRAKTSSLGVRLEASLVDRLAALAKENRRTLTAEVLLAIESYLRRPESI